MGTLPITPNRNGPPCDWTKETLPSVRTLVDSELDPVMPNLNPPVVTVADAQHYREQIISNSASAHFNPLMTLYLTAQTQVKDITQAVATDFVKGRDRNRLEKLAEKSPLRKIVEPEDVAKAIMAYVTHLKHSTGARIVIDSGSFLN